MTTMVEEAVNKSKISIWWDIENCNVPKDVDPHFIAQNLSSALHRANLTGPIEIQVFGDTRILPYNTQKALTDTGITLNHVPRGNKDAADKAILVAMLLWALDNPPPANILLISGDGDFANALHRLRWKTYSILLACPAQFVKPALIGAAKKLWCWKDLAQGQLAEPDLSQPSGDISQEPSVSSGPMDKFQQKPGSGGFKNSVMPTSVVPNGYASPQRKGPQSEENQTAEHFRTLNLENHRRSCSSTLVSGESRNGSHGTENSYYVLPDRRTAQAASNTFSPTSKPNLNASQSKTHAVEKPHPAAHSMDFGQYPYFLPGAAEMKEIREPLTSSALCSNTDVPRPPLALQFPNTPAGPMPRGPLNHITPDNRSANNVLPVKHIAPDNRAGNNVPVSQFHSTPAGPIKHIAPDNRAGNNVPASQFHSSPAGPMPRGPLNHIAPDNRSANNVPPLKHIAPNNRAGNNVPPQNRPAAASSPVMPPSHATTNLEDVSHNTCLDKVYSAMKTLERDMLAPTEGNLYDCIRYWDPQHEKVDVKQTLFKAAGLCQVTKTQLGRGLVMYLPPDHKVPWNCVDPGDMQYNYRDDVWLELQQFLLNGESKQVFLASCSRYDAAQILKNSSSSHIKDLVVGRIIHLLQQAMQRRKWLRKNGSGWAPLFVNPIGDFKLSNQGESVNNWKPVLPANVQSMWDKDAILNKLRSWLPQIIKDSSGYDLSLLSRDFELATGMCLDHQKLGFATLQELMKELSDVAYVEPTKTGLVLLHLIKQNGNVVGLNNNSVISIQSGRNDRVEKEVSKQENDAKALRQIQVVRDLKSWLSYLMTVVQNGYDITKIHQDFLQASGKDLDKEGLDFNKLQGILKQFPDVIQLAKTSVGIWVAYPASQSQSRQHQ